MLKEGNSRSASAYYFTDFNTLPRTLSLSIQVSLQLYIAFIGILAIDDYLIRPVQDYKEKGGGGGRKATPQ